MKKITSLVFGLLAALCAQVALAQTDKQTFKYIKPLVLAYSNSIGCADTEVNPKHVTKFSDKANGLENVYIAMISSDIDCAGGSVTNGHLIVVVGQAKMRVSLNDAPELEYLKVYPELSEPFARSTLPARGITGFYTKGGQLYATAFEYDPSGKDPNCCPSVKATYRVNLKKKSVSLAKDDVRELYTWEFTSVKGAQP